ncbi:MAG: hypothetical protein HQM10_15900 [Candidatus Riflebacteria bacterium]|nr:hypothetical protein [Candidatus Riflebacteria bacterium]
MVVADCSIILRSTAGNLLRGIAEQGFLFIGELAVSNDKGKKAMALTANFSRAAFIAYLFLFFCMITSDAADSPFNERLNPVIKSSSSVSFSLFDRTLIQSAKFANSIDTVFSLLERTSNNSAKEQIILSAINTPGNFQEIVRLAGKANSLELSDRILMANVSKIRNGYDIVKLANLASKNEVRDAIIIKGSELADAFDKVLFFSQQCYYPENCDKILCNAEKFALSSFDFRILSLRAKTASGRDRLIRDGLTKCRNFQDVIDLCWRATDPELRDICSQKAFEYARSAADIAMCIELAGTDQQKAKLRSAALPEGAPSYPDRVKKMNEIRENYGVRLCDNGTSYFTPEQLSWIEELFQALPENFVRCSGEMYQFSDGSPFVLGTTFQHIYTNASSGAVTYSAPIIKMSDLSCREENKFKGLVVHELAHALHYTHEDVLNKFVQVFWPGAVLTTTGTNKTHTWTGAPKSPSVSDYGNSMPPEDFAESARLFWEDPEKMKKEFPDRYKFMKDNVFVSAR